MRHETRKCSFRGKRARGFRHTDGSIHPGEEIMESYALGHLTESESRRFYGHLSECCDCRFRLREVIKTIKTIRDVLVLAELNREGT